MNTFTITETTPNSTEAVKGAETIEQAIKIAASTSESSKVDIVDLLSGCEFHF